MGAPDPHSFLGMPHRGIPCLLLVLALVPSLAANPAAIRTPDDLVATGKPVCRCKFGAGSPRLGNRAFDERVLSAAIRERMPRTVFFVHWWDGNAGWVGRGLANTSHVPEALADPWVPSRDDLAHFGVGP